MQRKHKIIIIVAIIVILPILGSNLSKEMYVDLNTGKMLSRYALFDKNIYSKVTETSFSEKWILYFKQAPSPNWALVNKFEGIVGLLTKVSGRHEYHTAFGTQNSVISIFNSVTAYSDDNTRKSVMTNFIQIRIKEGNSGAVKYINSLYEKAEKEK